MKELEHQYIGLHEQSKREHRAGGMFGNTEKQNKTKQKYSQLLQTQLRAVPPKEQIRQEI